MSESGKAALVGLGVIGAATIATHLLDRGVGLGAVRGIGDLLDLAPVTVDYMGPGNVKLNDADLSVWQSRHPGWSRGRVAGRDCIIREYSFRSRKAARRFAEQLSEVSDQYNHHPMIEYHEDSIEVMWFSHDVGGITSRDTAMAERTDALIECTPAFLPPSAPPTFSAT
jgi:4a-hydroxytetrahydrobiopterin dehydratase